MSVLLPLLAAGTLLSITVSTALGPVQVPLGGVWQVVGNHLAPDLFNPVANPLYDQIVWQFRLPRALAGAVIGAALALVGCTLQATVRNPLADPYLLGVSSGAAFGAVAVIVLGAEFAFGMSMQVAALTGALVAMLLVYLLAQRGGRLNPLRLVLAGVALAYLFQAVYSFLILLADPYATRGVLFWLLGSLGSIRWDDLGLPTVALAVGIVLLLLQSRPLNSLLAGDESAAALGVNVNRFRLQMFVLTSVLVGVMVAISGAIAFVGLIIPHFCRLLVGADHRRLLPTAAFVGAIFLVLVDLAARTVSQPMELPLSIVTAVFGVPFFLWLLRRRDRRFG